MDTAIAIVRGGNRCQYSIEENCADLCNLARLQCIAREIPISFLFRSELSLSLSRVPVARYAIWFHGLAFHRGRARLRREKKCNQRSERCPIENPRRDDYNAAAPADAVIRIAR